MNLTVSPRAADELKRAVEGRSQEQGPDTVRVLVQSQCGCGAAHFAMGFDEPQDDDARVDVNGITLLGDPASAPFLEDAQVDYSDDLMGKGFQINSPTGGCGCGGHGGHHH